jgi:ABC-type transport system substrate-binding protein
VRRPRALRSLALGALAAAVVAAVVVAAPAVAQKWADPGKVLRVTFPVAETGFDPQATSDLYSGHVQRAIFEPLYAYDYLARPYRLVPNTAAALPEISPDGRTWTIRIRPGIHFADDPVFKGRKRELTAHDYVFAWKRLLDPRMRSPYLWYLDGKLVGAERVLAKAREAGKLDYDAEIEGLRALDRHTLQVRLVEPDYVLMGYMAHAAMSAVAREVVETYGDASGWVMANPVGTGPFRLAEWRRGQKIVLEANPGFREEHFPTAGEPADAPTIARMKGKRLPQVGRVEISIIEESNPQLLAFNSGALDYANVPPDLVPNALDGGNRLKPYYAEQGVRHWRTTRPSLAYTYFNMEDPVLGGYAPAQVALRRAIVMGFNVRELIDVWYQGQAIEATQPIPPVVSGHVAEGVGGTVPHDPKLAGQLLDRFGYRDRDGDGFRELPDGRPLSIVMGTGTTGRDRARDELWKKSMTRLGLRLDFLVQKWPDLLKMGRAGKLQMWPVGWITQYNEGDAFMQLLYSRNIGQSNYARFALPEYDELYRQTKRLPAGPERTALYRKMSELVNAYNPWDLGVWQVENTLVRPWLDGYKKHAFNEHAWQFYDVDVARRAAAAKR